MLFMAVVGIPGFQGAVQMKDIEIIRELDKDKTFVDDFVHIKIKIRNKSSKRVDYIEIFDIFPGDGSFKMILGENAKKLLNL